MGLSVRGGVAGNVAKPQPLKRALPSVNLVQGRELR